MYSFFALFGDISSILENSHIRCLHIHRGESRWLATPKRWISKGGAMTHQFVGVAPSTFQVVNGNHDLMTSATALKLASETVRCREGRLWCLWSIGTWCCIPSCLHWTQLLLSHTRWRLYPDAQFVIESWDADRQSIWNPKLYNPKREVLRFGELNLSLLEQRFMMHAISSYLVGGFRRFWRNFHLPNLGEDDLFWRLRILGGLFSRLYQSQGWRDPQLLLDFWKWVGDIVGVWI